MESLYGLARIEALLKEPLEPFVVIYRKSYKGMEHSMSKFQFKNRSRSLVDDCFTRQAPDVHEGRSQIQASAPSGRAGTRLVGGGWGGAG